MNLNSAIAKDDFPAPVLPTIATFSPSSTLNEIPFSTGSRFGLKKTSLNPKVYLNDVVKSRGLGVDFINGFAPLCPTFGPCSQLLRSFLLAQMFNARCKR